MRKFLVVGCGGSGGRTVRLLIDQLSADFRARGWGKLPDAWQFVHIDVSVEPDKGPDPLGSIHDLGGQYLALSSPTASYKTISQNVESRIAQKGGDYSPLLGWAPKQRHSANSIPVQNGAGQYRAVGRMLTLPRLIQLRDVLANAQAKAVAQSSWGQIPKEHHGGDVVIPIVVASMAGGSGASMFLDVCRVLGQIPGINPANIGCFIYTADVFAELPDGQKANIEGNAMAALPEIIAAISRLSEDHDLSMMAALGLNIAKKGQPAFQRVLPIGRKIGTSGAFFGDGSMDGVYRGIARALAGIIGSEQASADYINYFLGNPTPVDLVTDRFGWKINSNELPFGSLGFASLSLGTDRYIDYAAQRLSKASLDHLVKGHENPASQLPSQDQLRALMDNQWDISLQALGLPRPGEPVQEWFSRVVLPVIQADALAAEAASPATNALQNTGSATAAAWLTAAQAAVASTRSQVVTNVNEAVYRWAEGWAQQLEAAAKEEFVRVAADFGLPYGRELMTRVRELCDRLVSEMTNAGLTARQVDPVALDATFVSKAKALGNQSVSVDHAIGQKLRKSILTNTGSLLRREAAGLGARVLGSYALDVLRALEVAANEAQRELEVSMAKKGAGGAGLAQLHTPLYSEWPDETGQVPPRFKHAENEVLLITADEFPKQFAGDVARSFAAGTYQESLARLRSQVLKGEWDTAGAKRTFEVLTQSEHWRPSALPRSATDGQPTPEAHPRYSLAFAAVDLITRSHGRLASRGDVFAQYAGRSISEYLNDPGITGVDRDLRRQDFVARFKETLGKARPVVGVDEQMAQRLHNLAQVDYEYSFSEIPLAAQDPVASDILRALEADPAIAVQTSTRFTAALQGATAAVGKISVFGSYPKVAPLCYSSLLQPIRQRWDAAPESTRRSLWLWKRSRPLSAALAMSREEAIDLAAGWYLGRLIGLVRHGADSRSAAVISPQGWLDFGPLLESKEAAVRTSFDLLPAVLMSHAWALARSAGDPDLTPLAPYEALRKLIDDSGSNQARPMPENLVGTQLLCAAFYDQPMELGGSRIQGDGLSPVLVQAVSPDQSATAHTRTADRDPAAVARLRYEATVRWLGQLRGKMQQEGYYRDGRPYASSPKALQDAHLAAELPPLLMPALDLIETLAKEAVKAPPSGNGDGEDDGVFI